MCSAILALLSVAMTEGRSNPGDEGDRSELNSRIYDKIQTGIHDDLREHIYEDTSEAISRDGPREEHAEAVPRVGPRGA